MVNADPLVLPCTDSVWVRRLPAGGSLSTTWSTLRGAAEVDLDPLRERVVGALPVGGLVPVGDVAGAVRAVRAAGRGGLAGGQVRAGRGRLRDRSDEEHRTGQEQGHEQPPEDMLAFHHALLGRTRKSGVGRGPALTRGPGNGNWAGRSGGRDEVRAVGWNEAGVAVRFRCGRAESNRDRSSAGVDLVLGELAGRPAGVTGEGQPQVALAGGGEGDRRGVAGRRVERVRRRTV